MAGLHEMLDHTIIINYQYDYYYINRSNVIK